jgi:hypothetical protein
LAHDQFLTLEEVHKKELEIFKRIDTLTKSCTKQYFNKILTKLACENSENANTICDYITAEETEINIQNSTKEGRIKILVWLSKYHDNKKSFKELSKGDILEFLNNLRKPVSEDPTQRWIGSYNGRQIILSKFFRWLYNPSIPDHTRRETPDCIKGIKQLPRKEKHPIRLQTCGNQESILYF